MSVTPHDSPQFQLGTEALLDPQGHAGHPGGALRGGGGSGRGSARVPAVRVWWTPTTLPAPNAPPPPQHAAEGPQHADAAARGCQRARLHYKHRNHSAAQVP